MKKAVCPALRGEEGQVVVLVAILFLALVFAIALVVNTGILFVERRAAQEAADAAALAGIYRFAQTGDSSQAAQAARDGAALNGYALTYTVGASAITGDINMPPVSGPHTGDPYFIEVVITTSVSATLVPQWGQTAVKARAVAGGGGIPTQAIYSVGGTGLGLQVKTGGVLAMYKFDPQATDCGYDQTRADAGQNPFVKIDPATGTASLPVTDCSGFGGEAQVDSTADPAAKNFGSGGAVGPPSAETTVVGSDATCTQGTPFPNLTCQQPSLDDPFAGFPKPVAGSTNWCRQDLSNNPSVVCGTYGSVNGCPSGTSYVLQPGIYTGQVKSNCGNDTSDPSLGFLLKPGIYIFQGTEQGTGIKDPSNIRVLGNKLGDTFEVTAGVPGPPGVIGMPGTRIYQRDGGLVPGGCGPNAGPTAQLCGVLLFFTYENYVSQTPTGGTCASFSISGGKSADLAPESTWTWGGMLIYYDPGPTVNGAPYCVGNSLIVSGGSQLNGGTFRGLIYAPTASITVNGNTSGAVLSQVVAHDIAVGSGTVIVNVASATTRVRAGFRLTE